MIRIADIEAFRAGLWRTTLPAEVVTIDGRRLWAVADENLIPRGRHDDR